MKPWEKYQESNSKPWEKYSKESKPIDIKKELLDQQVRQAVQISQIPNSAKNLVDNLTYPVRHPIQTGNAVKGLFQGLYEKTQPGDHPSEQIPDAVVDSIKDNYGSFEKARDTAVRDPLGMASDIGGLLTGATVTKRAATLPAMLTAKSVDERTPIGLYQSGAKFTTKPKDYAQRDKNIQTALDEGLLPTDAGVDKLIDTVNILNSKIDEIIDTATAQGKKIPSEEVFKYIDDLKKRMGGVKIDGARDKAIISEVADDFKRHLDALGKKELTPRELQDLKIDAYRKINFDLKQGAASEAKNETRKAIAKSAKEGIEDLNPDVQMMNAREGRLLELAEDLQRSSARIENRDWMGIGTPIKIAAGDAVGGGAGTAVAAGASILDMPLNKARLAIALHNLKNKKYSNLIDPVLAGNVTYQGLLQGGKLSEDEDIKGLLGR